jgi:hypothetical protein
LARLAGRLEKLPVQLLGLVQEGTGLGPRQSSGVTRHANLEAIIVTTLSPVKPPENDRGQGPVRSKKRS